MKIEYTKCTDSKSLTNKFPPLSAQAFAHAHHGAFQHFFAHAHHETSPWLKFKTTDCHLNG